MKRFEFKLESLLKYKRHLEQMARQEMAKAVSQMNECTHQIQTLKENRETSALRLDHLVEKGVNSREFNLHHGFLSVLDRMIIEEQDRKIRLEKMMEEKRSLLKKRTIDKKAMERLRERRADEYTREIIRQEQKELDEIASLKKAREIINVQI
ncbi:MAG: flagellar export protein FliJ [Desulfobacter sp.]|nr:flagellar export protein FliJ [Desulfobacter sp.]WDP87292.1 MAG: flagellar export protein FliJ [Desulfobacter sp.]